MAPNMRQQQKTFWNFLQNHKIEIPIIQRDYAQGRKGKEHLRAKFLKDLKEAIDEHKQLKLDFVYGIIENGDVLNPLDGQQRLTTLWLLHWYIAYKAEKLKEYKETFKKFTYETRVSSREFCERLSDFAEPLAESPIVEHIQNQTWFYSAWKQDPTIQAMLNMLGGTPDKDKDGDIMDGMEKIFLDDSDWNKYWNELTKVDCPIIFYYQPLSDFGLSDDLYIKMNARGKALTNFENFKADLVGYIKKEEWEKGKKPQDTIACKLDTGWTDIFWHNKSAEYKIDEIYFAFFNRYFLNILITAQKDEKGNLLTAEKIEKERRVFKILYGNQSDDSNLKYEGFNIYDEGLAKNAFENLSKIFDNIKTHVSDIKNLSLPFWDTNDKFRFIPEYQEKTITTLTQSQRVVFHAICCYFEKEAFEKESFQKWMRVVWNIVENADVNTISSMIGTMRLIDELSEHSHDIYSFLAGAEIIKSDIAKEQVAEEREKSRKIREDASWEQKIIEAEKMAFFKGAIRFMFTDKESHYNWSLFENRYEKSKEYFTEKGVADHLKDNAALLRALINGFTGWEHFKKLTYDNNASTWKSVLTNKVYFDILGVLFENVDITKIDFSNFNSVISTANDLKLRDFHNDLVKTSFLSKIDSGCVFHWWNYGGKYNLYPPNTKSPSKIYVLADRRNKIIFDLDARGIIAVSEWQKMKDLPYFKGWEIYFEDTKGNKYRWWDGLEVKTADGWSKAKAVQDIEKLEGYLNKLPEYTEQSHR
jgi:hypothetical protein